MAPASTSPKTARYVCGKRLRSTKTLDVWLAHDVALGPSGPRYLLKRLTADLAENPRLVEQFVLRGRRAMALQHRGIMRVLEVVLEVDDCYLVAEACEGHTLHEIFQRLRSCDNALPVWFALQVAHELSLALEYAHQGHDSLEVSGAIYHQGICSENVVITAGGEVKLVDFGLSRAALLGTDAVGTRRWSDSGEFDLWAPHFGDAQTDILGLARVLYELLTARSPGKRTVLPSRHSAWISGDLDRLVGRLFGIGGAERFTSLQEIREALAELLQRQRQPVDRSHLAGLLGLVMSSFPAPKDTENAIEPAPKRSKTILPAPIVAAEAERLEEPSPSSDPRPAHHDWDAAVTRVRRESQQPPASEVTPVTTTATDSFERGLEKLKLGDLLAAETEWLRALELDPNHRLSQVNLKLLRKLRDSERPAAER